MSGSLTIAALILSITLAASLNLFNSINKANKEKNIETINKAKEEFKNYKNIDNAIALYKQVYSDTAPSIDTLKQKGLIKNSTVNNEHTKDLIIDSSTGELKTTKIKTDSLKTNYFVNNVTILKNKKVEKDVKFIAKKSKSANKETKIKKKYIKLFNSNTVKKHDKSIENIMKKRLKELREKEHKEKEIVSKTLNKKHKYTSFDDMWEN